MYEAIRIQNEITNWDKENAGNTKSVRTVLVMDMLTQEEQAEVKKAHEEFWEKIKTVVPDNPPPPTVHSVSFDNY